MNYIITISVVIPSFNSEKTIETCLKSILSQTESVNEIIVIDDGSNDKSVTIIKEVFKTFSKNENGIKFILHEQNNSGPSVARNKGISLVKSSHIAFIDSDDIWHVDHIRIIKAFLKSNIDYKIIATKYLSAPISYFGDIVFEKLLLKNYFLTPCVVLNKDLFLKIEGFDEKMKYSEDYFLWLNIVFKNKGYLLDYVGAANIDNKKTFGEKGLSSNLFEMHRGVLHCYNDLYSKKMINFKTYLKIKNIERIKYIRRIVLTFINK